jgi:hypothetical protein
VYVAVDRDAHEGAVDHVCVGGDGAVRRVQIEDAVAKNETFPIAFDPFEAVEIGALRGRSQKIHE